MECKIEEDSQGKTLDRREFNIPECPAHAHLYTAEFHLNYAWMCNTTFYSNIDQGQLRFHGKV